MAAKKPKKNPKKRPATMADVERAKKRGTREAVEFAWAVIFTALRDKEGMELEDLRRIWQEVNDVAESFEKGYITIADLKKVLKDEIGVEPE